MSIASVIVGGMWLLQLQIKQSRSFEKNFPINFGYHSIAYWCHLDKTNVLLFLLGVAHVI